MKLCIMPDMSLKQFTIDALAGGERLFVGGGVDPGVYGGGGMNVHWIKNTDRKPADTKPYLCRHDDDGIIFGMMRTFNHRTGLWTGLSKDQQLTHWLEGLEWRRNENTE